MISEIKLLSKKSQNQRKLSYFKEIKDQKILIKLLIIN